MGASGFNRTLTALKFLPSTWGAAYLFRKMKLLKTYGARRHHICATLTKTSTANRKPERNEYLMSIYNERSAHDKRLHEHIVKYRRCNSKQSCMLERLGKLLLLFCSHFQNKVLFNLDKYSKYNIYAGKNSLYAHIQQTYIVNAPEMMH